MKRTSKVLGTMVGLALFISSDAGAQSADNSLKSLKMAVEDIEATFGDAYDGEGYLKELAALGKQPDPVLLAQLQRKALLANPAIDFDSLVFVRRKVGAELAKKGMNEEIGLVRGNFYSLANAPSKMDGNEISLLGDFKSKPKVTTLHRRTQKLITEIDLRQDAKKLMFSSTNDQDAFRLFEMNLDGSDVKQVTPDTDGNDVDHFDSCYLPDGNIIFTSTATFSGMPCITGVPRMASLYKFFPQTGKIRQLSFDQDSSWFPTVLNNGNVMYLRWEYSDLAHSNSRILMSMHPDGTSQKSYMFSNSWFPNAFMFARPIPGHPTQVVGIAGGHHGVGRVGRMLLVDPSLGEREADGVVQEIPGYGKKVDPIVKDGLVNGVFPLLTHPYPIAEAKTNKGAGKYFIVSMKPTRTGLFGIYLVDIYDNMTLLYEDADYVCFEPIPLKTTPVQPLIPSMVDLTKKTASVYIQDIYYGPGLAGIPRGTVKSLRIGSYEFSPSASVKGGSGGKHGTLGIDGPWDIKRILGTVPVYEDGSVHFTVPAQTPIFMQPLDENGQALQLMRSWFTGQPGERLSCVGCHESSRSAPLSSRRIASTKAPVEVTPWYGPTRNFGFITDIRPIVDRKCMSCHDGKPAAGRYSVTRADYKNKPIPYLGTDKITDWKLRYNGTTSSHRVPMFSKGYFEIFKVLRGPGIETEMPLQVPKNFSADTTELVQMLKKGHHGVKLDQEEWDKLICWIDLNTPYHSNRADIIDIRPTTGRSPGEGMRRSNELAKKYSPWTMPFVVADPTEIETITPIHPDTEAYAKAFATGKKPFQVSVGKERKEPIKLDLGNSTMNLVYIPSGSFTMGSASGAPDELPMHTQQITKGFWMADAEVLNAQYRLFEKEHSSRTIDHIGYQFGMVSIDINGDELPAVRVSWDKAMAFCEWLSQKTGKKVTLPTEVQWEWACRAGQGTDLWFGNVDDDFSPYENLADHSLIGFAKAHASKTQPFNDVTPYELYIPRADDIDDGGFLTQPPKKYKANPWGLYDMHGNVAEWTRSAYESYPLTGSAAPGNNLRVVRGGSWRDRAYRSTSSFRTPYPAFQRVYNVGFRVIIED
jgi:formylglycine-generating enzyme required for sulfatase activity